MRLNKTYNQNDFLQFLDNFLPEDFDVKEEDVVITKERYKKIKEVKILGSCDSIGIHILEMEHESENDPRITIATDAFKILADHWIHKALVIFKSANSENYRFSLLTISLDLNEKNKPTKQYSNAHRYSFYLGPGAKVNTPIKYLIDKGKIVDFDDLKNRFSVEVVNEEFFTAYKKLYKNLVESIGKDKRFSIFAKEHSIKIEDFAKKLLGQIAFLYFLQRKGWLGAKEGEPFDLGDKNFLRSLYDKAKREISANVSSGETNFFNDYLEYLFYDSLNKEPEKSTSFCREKFGVQIPFLNGGLFEPITNYSWKDHFLQIPDEIFSNGKDGILDIFDLYNFTIDESTINDQEVSVDPEMLGKVFERLLDTRKDTGSFYTPREIVSYMVKESLKQYLIDSTKIKDEIIKELINNHGLSDENATTSNLLGIENALKNIKIIDPAVGSGAFPVGALQEITGIRSYCSDRLFDIDGRRKKQSVYDIKKDIIENNLYGIDIDPGAIDIARLRFWLSLIVDANANEIEPLPNLDFKLTAANTLIPLDEGKEKSLFDNPELENQIQEIRLKYFRARTLESKERLKDEYNKLVGPQSGLFDGAKSLRQKQLESFHPFDQQNVSDFFDPDFMFGIKSFDVVIANPPYIQIKQIPWEERKVYKKKFMSAVGRFNIFYFFLELSSRIDKQSGLSTFIVPDRLLLNTQCDKLRKWLLQEQTIIEVDSFAEGVFEAVVDSIIIFYSNKKSSNKSIKVKNRVNLKDLLDTKPVEIPVSYFLNSPNNQFNLSYSPKTARLIEKIKDDSLNLSEISKIKDGIIQGKVADKLFLKEPLDKFSKPLLFGENIGRYSISFGKNWVNYKPDEMMEIEVKRREPGVRHGLWMRTPEIFERLKILTRQTADEIIAAYDPNHYYYSNTLHGTTIIDRNYEPKYVLALLNSKLMSWYYKSTTAEGGKVFAQIKIEILKQLPIKNASLDLQRKFSKIVDKILAITKESDYLENPAKQAKVRGYEEQIDQLVYKLYSLTPEEIKIIENSK